MKIHASLVRRLKRKLTDKDMALVASRKKGAVVQRPHARTPAAFHDATLEGAVNLAETVGNCVENHSESANVTKAKVASNAI
ncbi:hypothetical protein E2562_022454 [Oryza meyeriana var. granulata]|uniref:Uncharacterized protein n=1 Tax=Oryza meyeriana var. granulata TaxID=110450 RepID=A0A6G1BLH9_9ORYZ|nr:hypothetical protein E2562_022454 [Oryza meyeriana var. granulata]